MVSLSGPLKSPGSIERPWTKLTSLWTLMKPSMRGKGVTNHINHPSPKFRGTRFIRGTPSKPNSDKARSLEDETRNANRNSEWWVNVSQLQIQIKPKSGFECVPQDTEEFKFNQNLNSNLYRKIPRNLIFSILTSWLKSPHHSGFRFAFRRTFRISSSMERAAAASLRWTVTAWRSARLFVCSTASAKVPNWAHFTTRGDGF